MAGGFNDPLFSQSIRKDEIIILRRDASQFYGLEYENCCWGLRLVYRQYLSTRNGLEDSSFGLQLILKGMANIGARADRLLERGILGYSHDFE